MAYVNNKYTNDNMFGNNLPTSNSCVKPTPSTHCSNPINNIVYNEIVIDKKINYTSESNLIWLLDNLIITNSEFDSLVNKPIAVVNVALSNMKEHLVFVKHSYIVSDNKGALILLGVGLHNTILVMSIVKDYTQNSITVTTNTYTSSGGSGGVVNGVTQQELNNAINGLLGQTSYSTIPTIAELSASINDDPDFYNTMRNLINMKLDKTSLSTLENKVSTLRIDVDTNTSDISKLNITLDNISIADAADIDKLF